MKKSERIPSLEKRIMALGEPDWGVPTHTARLVCIEPIGSSLRSEPEAKLPVEEIKK